MGTFIFYPCSWSLTHFLTTLTLLITFEQWVLELWYFTRVFLEIRPFRGYHYFDTLILTLEFDPFLGENFNLANNFWTASAKALRFHMSLPCDKTLFFYKYWSFHIAYKHFSWQDLPNGIKIFVLVVLIVLVWNWPLAGAFVFIKHILF